MKKIVSAAAILAVLGVATLVINPLSAQGDKVPTPKEIMGKLNKGPNALHAMLGKALKSDEPAWDDIQKETKEYSELAAGLGKNDPPKGDKDSWAKLTKTYAENAKALADGAEKKDKAAMTTAHGKIGKSCKSCHDAHRGK